MFFEPLCFCKIELSLTQNFFKKKIKYTVEEIFHKKKEGLQRKNKQKAIITEDPR